MKKLSLFFLLSMAPTLAHADPCGMVPPIWEGPGPAITRVGVQQTYVFYKEGIESFVIRPAFSGKVDEFGMLIPFPTPPAIRKVDDAIFSHLKNAVEPPPVVIYPAYPEEEAMAGVADDDGGGLEFKRKQVRVLRQEAVGMYEVAVLEAGSAKALKRWLDEHGYQYPTGMDEPCQDYVNLGWCFVAVKTQVGQKKGVTPRPGMKDAKPKLPAGASFDGSVQAMGFRFRTDDLVVPMRLSAFNEGKLHNVVYLLTDRPMKIDRIPESLVKEQIPGSKLLQNVTALLPLRVEGGSLDDVEQWHGKGYLKRLEKQRDPEPKNGLARDLFASDLVAVRGDRLALAHEEKEKVLLRIGERLGLRGEDIDGMHRLALQAERKAAIDAALKDLELMTLTVIDGEFPREVLSEANLTFSPYVKQGLDSDDFAKPRSIKGKAR